MRGSADARSDGENKFSAFIEAAGGLDQIEQLQTHPNERIYSLAYDIISTYFSDGCGRAWPRMAAAAWRD